MHCVQEMLIKVHISNLITVKLILDDPCLQELMIIYPADPIFIDFGRLPAWNCPMDEDTESNEIPEGPSVTSHHNTNDPDDLESEPSYNLRRKQVCLTLG